MYYLTPFARVYVYILAGLFGACMGSFLNCMAWRVVHGESVLKGRSHCDVCGHALGIRDLFPVFSYLFHRGKCRYCGCRLPLRYLLSEVISALVFVTLLLKYDISLQVLEYLLFACVLLVCAFADLEGYIIPDRFIVTGLFVRLVFLFLPDDILHSALDAAIGGIAIPGVLLLVVLVMEKILKREAMGGGDIKLLAVTGVFLGWKLNLLCLLLACVLGILFGLVMQSKRKSGKNTVFPWGPSVAAAAWITLLFGDQLLSMYLNLF